MNPWPGKQVVTNEVGKVEPIPFQLDASDGECIVFSALAGHEYLIANLTTQYGNLKR
jgi:hypothetical protein